MLGKTGVNCISNNFIRDILNPIKATYACYARKMFALKCSSPSYDDRYRPKHVKVWFILKIVTLDGN
jgi:hypothetical protein